jgi:FPC/CPF motif-containing protein YcgG
MNEFILKEKSYPCIAAIKSMQQKEFLSGYYGKFGTAENWTALRNDLRYFIRQQAVNNSSYLTFWALFETENYLSEDDFEAGMWNELSHLSSEEDKKEDWGNWPMDPEHPGFSLCIDGERFFVVGLHPHSSRMARRFPRPALVFNLSRQFENLKQAGQFAPMKEAVRKRDIKLQGRANPMVVEHDDHWESIQYSGKENSKSWQCPFHFFSHDEKQKPRMLTADTPQPEKDNPDTESADNRDSHA